MENKQLQVKSNSIRTNLLETFLSDIGDLTAEELSQLTPEKVLGRKELNKAEYTHLERKAIELLLLQLGLCRKENVSGYIDIWINEFAGLNIRAYEVMQRIRLAKLEKKYGEIDFSVFMNVNISNYSKYFNYGNERTD